MEGREGQGGKGKGGVKGRGRRKGRGTQEEKRETEGTGVSAWRREGKGNERREEVKLSE